MTEAALQRLAEQAGVAPRWKDFQGNWHEVGTETLRAVLAALDLPAATDAEIAQSLAATQQDQALLPLMTATAGQPTPLSVPPGRYRLMLEDGEVQEGEIAGGMLPPVPQPGYHRLFTGGQETVLAVAPPRCFAVEDAAPGARPWALAVQLYGLRRANDGGLGDFGALRDFVPKAAAHGAAGIAISPVHAQFSADPDRFSPYSPSSRLQLNVLHAALDLPDAAGAEFVDWPAAGRMRLEALRARFEAAGVEELAALSAYRAEAGSVVETHATFEALHAHFFGADPSHWHWRSWPAAYRRPDSPAVHDFVREHPRAVMLHAYMQMLAERGLEAAQHATQEAGMPIGLIADLAVGADSGGSQCWSRQDEMLLGLTVGAPPDLLSPNGQNWGLAAFSPRGLARNGFGAFLDMLRQAMRHAGGVRIDHAMGLARLWVVPDGMAASEGAYLHFPLQDMVRLIALESHRHRCVVLGEDLGTVPDGFQRTLEDASILGMRVLWFERDHNHFNPPGGWSTNAAAMTGTHDLPTVAGWWVGRDLEWRHRLDLFGGPENDHHENHERGRDRTLLWQAFQASGAAEGSMPPPDQPGAVVDAALRHVAAAPCALLIAPIEDVLGLLEQPNLPGTLDTHPNWRRRYAGPAATLLDDPAVTARLRSLNEARSVA